MPEDDDRAELPGTRQPDTSSGHVIDFGQLGPASAGRGSGEGDDVPGDPRHGDPGYGDPACGGSSYGGSARRRRGWTTWLPLGLAACLGAAIGVHLATSGGSGSSVALPPPTPPAAPTLPSGGSTNATSSEPVYFEVPTPILGITDTWELFGYGDGEVVRIQFGDGGITRTAIPPLQSTGPVYLLAGRGWAMVRPLDGVPGYLVRDRVAAGRLARSLDEGGPAMPGPDDDDIWIPAGEDGGSRVQMALTDVDGHRVGPRIWLPRDVVHSAQPDDAGYFVVTGADGVYAARPGGLRRITTGSLLAAGPTRWLTLECDEAYRCGMYAIDRAGGAKRPIGGAVDDAQALQPPTLGRISPDGTFAAVVEPGLEGTPLHLINLNKGGDRQLTVPLGESPDAGGNAMVFSPDSRWLFVAGEGGVLYAIDTASGAAQTVGPVLPPLRQLVMRDASA